MSEANPTDGRPADGSGARLHTGSSTWGFAIPYLSAALVLVGLSVARVGSVSFAPANQAPVSQASAATLVYTDNALSIGPSKATPLLKGFRSGDRIRLGDVVSTDVPNVMIAALWDDRFTIVPPVAASPVPPNEARCAISVGDPFFVRVGMPSNPPPDVVQKNLPQKEFENLPEALPPPNKAALPNEPGIPEQKAPRYENPTGQPLSEREKGTLLGATSPFRIVRSTQQIATSAIMVALLKADAEGASSLSLGSFRFSPSGSDPKQDMVTLDTAGADAVSRVWHHLGSVRMVYVESPAPATFPSNLVAALASYLTTSLPFPGGAAFLEPKIIDSASVSANPANLFNPAFSVEEPITRLPAITFITLSVLGFLLGRRRQTTDC